MRRNGERFDALLIEAPLIDADGRQIGWMGLCRRDRAEACPGTSPASRSACRPPPVCPSPWARWLDPGLHELKPAPGRHLQLQHWLPQHAGSTGIAARRADRHPAKIGKQAQRAAQIIRRVHALAAPQRTQVRNCRPRRRIREAVGPAEPGRRLARRRHRPDLADGLPGSPADPVMIEQVAINLPIR